MEKSGFFNARKQLDGTYDRTYLAEEFAKFFSRFLGNGVYPNPSTGLQVLENDEPDMTVNLQTGYALINGYAYYNDGVKPFTVDVADGLLNRKDAIFVRWDKVNRQITSVYVKGSLSSDPVAPTPLRTADIWDLCATIINVKAGVTKITQADIEDTRMNKELCGIVTAVIEQVDTTTLYLQVQKDLENFQDVSYEEFNTWFDQMKDQLSTDAAGKLQLQLDDVKSDLGTVKKTVTNLNDGVTVSLPKDAWVGDAAPYTQTVSVVGMTADRTLSPPISKDNTQGIVEVSEALGLICAAETLVDNIKVYATDKPEIDLTVVFRG